MAKNDIFRGGYEGNRLEMIGQLEGSGSSGRIDAEITASEDSSGPMRKCINLNSDKQENFGVPRQVLPLSQMLPPERRDLLRRLRFELEQVRMLQKKVELQRVNGITASSSGDILSCSEGKKKPKLEPLKKSAVMTSGPAKKVNPVGQACLWNRSSSGRFQSAKQLVKQVPTPSTENMIMMKKCDNLLRQVLAHRYAWVFSKPVDIVELNIPDYFNIIKHPMDLGTVKSKIASGAYSSPLEFLADVRLTFRNAMEYNPKGHDVHLMADTLSKYFEGRWKNIEKKLPITHAQDLPEKSDRREHMEPTKTSPTKKRKTNSSQHENMPDPVRHKMSAEGRQNLARELESISGDMPTNIIDFLKEHLSNGRDDGEEEMEIDIDALDDDILFALQKLVDDYLLEKQKNQARGEPCEIELLNEFGLSNSSLHKGNDLPDEDVDIGGSEPPVSSYPPVEIEKDAGRKSSACISSGSSSGNLRSFVFSKLCAMAVFGHSLGDTWSVLRTALRLVAMVHTVYFHVPDLESDSSSEGETDVAKPASPVNGTKVPETLGSGDHLDGKTSGSDWVERNQSLSCLDELDQPSQQKPNSMELDGHDDGDSAPTERQVSPQKLLRAAQVKQRFAATIMKAKEKTLSQGDKKDPEKLRKEREELELYNKKVKAMLEAEAKAAEDIRKRLEEEAAAEAKLKREHEREAARQALLQMEKTVEINENSQLLQDLEMLRNVPGEHLPSSVDETSPGHSLDGLGGFGFGASNALEQLGLFMKDDEEEEECEPLVNNVPDPVNDMEEGEID
ncbi:hypothetical protein Tsubulata_003260 [Turnera subulata]|uniref:Bromo domain-containing protein n=1 Tax=Turnera subulata TaxID=218843 RepID=A0A9Q0F9E0_9ROSI|nr:hypothetical protein Tsubulata_003260 [Turnera subulata]